MGVGVSCFQNFEVKDIKLRQKYRENSPDNLETANKGLNESRGGKKEQEMSDVSKRGYLNLQTEDNDPSAPKQETRHMSLQTTAEIKEIKVIHSGGKRATMPDLSYKPKEKWGGSVPAFFQTTKQDVDIGDTLTPGKRRHSSRAHEFEVIAVNSQSGEGDDSAGHWEDKFEREADALRKRRIGGRKNLRPRIGSVRVEPLKPLKE